MENKVNELKDLDEREIVKIIYDKINYYWGEFPNIWKYTTKDDMASEVTIDLYRPRKADGIPHIIHYYKTKGDRGLHSLIGMFVYNNLRAEARDVHCTGIRNNDDRRNVKNAISIETPLCDDEGSKTLGDTLSDNSVNISKEIDYIMLYESLPDRIVDNVFYKVDNKYLVVSYKSLLEKMMNGYKITNIAENLYKKTANGSLVEFNGLSSVVREMKEYLKEFIQREYDYSEENYKKGCTLL